MIKRILVIFQLILSINIVNAQTAEFKYIDSLCHTISAVQASAVGGFKKNFNNLSNVSFNPNSFTSTFNNHKFQQVYALDEGLYITYAYDSIDLAYATDIVFEHKEGNTIGVAKIKLSRPTRLTTVKMREPSESDVSEVLVFYPLNDKSKRNLLLKTLMALIEQMQLYSQTATPEQFKSWRQKWFKAVILNTVPGYKAFLNDNPDSPFRGYAADRILDLDKTFKLADLNLGEFNFDMTRSQFEAIILKRIKNYQTDDKLLKPFIQNFSFKYTNGAYGFRQAQGYFYDGTPNYTANDATKFGAEILDALSYKKAGKYMTLINTLDDYVTSVPNTDLAKYIHIPAHIKLNRIQFDSKDKVKSLDFTCIIDPYWDYHKTEQLFETEFGTPVSITDKQYSADVPRSDFLHAVFSGTGKYSLVIDMQDGREVEAGRLVTPMVLVITITAN